MPKYLVYFEGRRGKGYALAEASDEQGAVDALYLALPSELQSKVSGDSPNLGSLSKVTIVDIDQSGFLGTDTAVIIDDANN